MKRNNIWAVAFTACLINTAVYADEATDITSDLANKLSPKELEAIQNEAAKLKAGKSEEPAIPTEKLPEPKSFMSETKKTQQPVERQRSLKQRESMHQGFYPSHSITQKPMDSLTERTIKPLNSPSGSTR